MTRTLTFNRSFEPRLRHGHDPVTRSSYTDHEFRDEPGGLVVDAGRATQIDAGRDFEKVTDPGEIASWGVMATPALVSDDEVVMSGRVPTVDDIKKLLAAR